jgi:hypothetical protein
MVRNIVAQMKDEDRQNENERKQSKKVAAKEA